METFYLGFLGIMELMTPLFILKNFIMVVLRPETINSILLFQPNLICLQVFIIKVQMVKIKKIYKRAEIREM